MLDVVVFDVLVEVVDAVVVVNVVVNVEAVEALVVIM